MALTTERPSALNAESGYVLDLYGAYLGAYMNTSPSGTETNMSETTMALLTEMYTSEGDDEVAAYLRPQLNILFRRA